MSGFITPRLEALISRVNGEALADIACDHAYISIGAVMKNRANYVIAADKSSASIEKAELNIQRSGFDKKIVTRVSDGFSEIKKGEASCAVIGGIGGRLMRGILLREADKTKSFKRLILEPQTETFLVRSALCELGLKIHEEDMVIEGEFFYPVIVAGEGDTEYYTDNELKYGKRRLIAGNFRIMAYLEHELQKAERVRGNISNRMAAESIELKIDGLKEALYGGAF